MGHLGLSKMFVSLAIQRIVLQRLSSEVDYSVLSCCLFASRMSNCLKSVHVHA